jgi:uncharacterized protein (DUF169 family)
MDMSVKEKFMALWKKYFNDAELPIVFYFSTSSDGVEMVEKPSEHVCVIAVLNRVRKGTSLCFEADSIGCFGGKRYLGYQKEIMPNFEYFLSCGIPGQLEGERYKKTPEMVKEIMKSMPDFTAPEEFIIFKRWDALEADDDPAVVIFYAAPDVLSGLFTLAGFDETEPASVSAPFSAGCGSIVMHPYFERERPRPKCILGMFDVSARPCVPAGMLTFAAPMKKFITMIDNMEESFLITPSWQKVQSRISGG